MVKVELSSESRLDLPGQETKRLRQSLRVRQNSRDLANILFDQCADCIQMACLPQAAFAVHKLRKPQNEKDLAVARLGTDKQEAPRYMNNKTLDLTPVKYSDKLMNSIWGLYNRYSPHNFKKNNGADLQYFGMQQPFAVACAAASEKKPSEANCSNPAK